MPTFIPKSQVVAAHQFNLYQSDTKHEHVVTATGGGTRWGDVEPLIEVPKGIEVLGVSTIALKNPMDGKLSELNDKDFIVYMEDGNVVAIPDQLFNLLFQKL